MIASALLVYGEALADLVPRDVSATVYEAVLGGSGFNTALALARFGAPTSYCAALSSDAIGARFRDRLAREGVDTRFCATSDAPTPLAVIAPIGGDGEAHYHFHLAGTALETAPASQRALAGFTHLHLSSFAATTGAAGAAALELAGRARAAGLSLSYDVNIRPAALPSREEAVRLIEQRIRFCDLVKASREDVAWLHPGEPPEEVAIRWLRAGPRLVLVTEGAEGASCHGADGRLHLRAPRVAVVDTIGAGDVFAAGILGALAAAGRLGAGLAALTRTEMEAAMSFASSVAADNCLRPGCDPPRRSAAAVWHGTNSTANE